MRVRVPVPLVVLVVGFTFSLAANVLWTWPGGPVRVLGGALASVALPAAVHMWPHVPVTGWPSRALRVVLMSLIGVGAAATTFAHAASLLVQHGEDPRLACAYPVITELLVVFAALARRNPVREVAPVVVRAPARARPARVSAPVAAPAPAVDGLVGRRSARDTMVEWLAARTPTNFSDEVDAVCTRFNVSPTTAKRVRRAVLEVRAAS